MTSYSALSFTHTQYRTRKVPGVPGVKKRFFVYRGCDYGKVDNTQSLEFHRCAKTGGERLAHHGELLKILVAEALRADELEEAIQRLACTTHETARKQASKHIMALVSTACTPHTVPQ